MKRKKVLVTGGAGYIGSHTVVELLARDYEVVIVDNFCNSEKSVIDSINKISGKRCKFFEGDICDEVFLNGVFASEHIDIVMHFAGLKAVGESCEKPLEYYKNNLTGTINLLACMKRHSVSTIVFSSSACVYLANPYKLPIKESSKLGATNPYGTTKFMIECMLLDITKADPNYKAVILRYFNPIGAHQSGLIGENPRGIPNNLAPYIMQVASEQRRCLNVFGNDYKTVDGTGVRDYIHVVDLALGHIAALENTPQQGAHIYNLGTGKATSVLQLVKSFEKACGKTIPYKICPRRDGDAPEYWADCEKAKTELGWVAKYNIDDMCKSMWNFIKHS